MLDQASYLGILSRASAEAVKTFADGLIPALGLIEVIENRTGLVMVPMIDTARGAAFYLGEVLIAEARVRVGITEGYGACLGRDLPLALAIALLDAALVAGQQHDQITRFVLAQAALIEAEEQALQAQIAATRVELETF
jgi:alpha-D-ribose 1-methylphosphonate 5-triphosphate synthase subunit PhnG